MAGGGEGGEKERSGCSGTSGSDGGRGGPTESAVQKRSVGLRQEGFVAAGGSGVVDGGVGKCSAAPRCAQYYV